MHKKGEILDRIRQLSDLRKKGLKTLQEIKEQSNDFTHQPIAQLAKHPQRGADNLHMHLQNTYHQHHQSMVALKKNIDTSHKHRKQLHELLQENLNLLGHADLHLPNGHVKEKVSTLHYNTLKAEKMIREMGELHTTFSSLYQQQAARFNKKRNIVGTELHSLHPSKLNAESLQRTVNILQFALKDLTAMNNEEQTEFIQPGKKLLKTKRKHLTDIEKQLFKENLFSSKKITRREVSKDLKKIHSYQKNNYLTNLKKVDRFLTQKAREELKKAN